MGSRNHNEDDGGREDDWLWTSWIRGRRRRWQDVGEKFWRVPSHVKQQRYEICRACEEFVAATTQCRRCWCAMGIKTWYAGFACPKGKWPAVPVPPDRRRRPGGQGLE